MSVDRVGPETIRDELERLSGYLSSPTRFVLFGGCCMSVRGIKDATKDVDAVVHDRDLHPLVQDLEDAGYEHFEEIHPATPFDFWVYVEREGPEGAGRVSIDLFPPESIMGTLSYSGRMDDRAEPWLDEDPLAVELAAPSDVFLLKSVTGRWRRSPGRDLEDMQTLLDQGLVDLATVETEWERQLQESISKPEEAQQVAQEAVDHLRDRGYTLGWQPGAGAGPEPPP